MTAPGRTGRPGGTTPDTAGVVTPDGSAGAVPEAAADGGECPIRVLLVDDQPLLRRSLAMVIDHDPGLTVVGQAGDGAGALAAVRAARPDVVLMDVRMPVLDGIQATRRICADPHLAATRVLVLSMFELDEYVHEALRAGASGFLLKDIQPGELIAAIRRAHSGEALFAPSILTRLVEHYLRTPAVREPAPVGGLTAREVEILALVGAGLSNGEIADHLTISVKTVKTHISHLLAKLGARDRVHLVIAAYDHGLVTPRAGA
ncbi:DNA-binding response regulator [Streptosporangium pseudovulgare]|uniref:DNA-binding response regulator n=1 Tax=Streptosporangium pseudovulgare TaxID=35765 RepID=A0ABQ2REF4_9ACTN|nr:DNA-binding response regulator [Streptosporangium pseudovulgare]